MIMLNHNLRIFLCVAEKGSITDAANALFISQPAVSKAIKIIEEELSLKLFFRDRRKGLILTDAGYDILLLARQMADAENRIYQTAFRSNNFIGGKVTVASMPILTSVILSPVFYEFRKKYPYVTLELLEAGSLDSRRSVEEHQADFALTSEPFGGLNFQFLMKDRMVAVSKKPLSEEHIVNLNIDPERFIFCRAGHETAMEMLKARRVNIASSFLVQQAETVLCLANDCNGIGILSELVLNHTANDLYRYPTEPVLEYDIGLAACDLNNLTPAAAELKNMIMDYIKTS